MNQCVQYKKGNRLFIQRMQSIDRNDATCSGINEVCNVIFEEQMTQASINAWYAEVEAATNESSGMKNIYQKHLQIKVAQKKKI